ncbi:MAG TPA: hypothetical protein DEB39_05670 [Planctomycetaceae bacterium]|nr:hypothetical protein [Planctomycetaceae bacterium]
MSIFLNRVRRWISANPAGKKVVVLFFFNGIVAALGLVTQVLITNRLGAEDYGFLTLAVAVGSYSLTVVRYGRERTMLRDLTQHPDDFGRIVGSTFLLGVALLLGILCVLFLYGLAVPGTVSPTLLLIVLAMSLCSLDFQPVYDARRQTGRHAAYMAVHRLTYYASVWTAALFLPRIFGPAWIGFSMLFGILIGLFPQYREVFRSTRIDLFDPKCLSWVGTTLKKNAGMALLSILDLVYGPAIVFSLFYWHGDTATGIYGVASLFQTAIVLVWTQVARVGNPPMTEIVLPGTSGKRRRTFLLKYFAALSCAVAPFVTLLFFFPGPVVAMIFRPEFEPAADVLPFFAATAVLCPFNVIAMQYVLAIRRDAAYISGVFATTCFGLAACATLIPAYGPVGAGRAFFLTSLLGTSINLGIMFASIGGRRDEDRSRAR